MRKKKEQIWQGLVSGAVLTQDPGNTTPQYRPSREGRETLPAGFLRYPSSCWSHPPLGHALPHPFVLCGAAPPGSLWGSQSPRGLV